MSKEAMKLALEAAYLAGWNASGEGYNAEYPFDDHARNPEEDAAWVKGRDDALLEVLAEQPAPMSQPNRVVAYSAASKLRELGYEWVDDAWRHLDELAEQPAQQKPVAKVDANDEGYWADILPDRTVKVGQLLYAEAPQPAQREPEYAWPTVADYENDVGFEVNQAFRMAWNMARTTNKMLGHTSTPAQRTWVGLVDEDVRQCSRDVVAGGSENSVDRFAYAIEAKLKERNQ